jgi:hypothetical protein
MFLAELMARVVILVRCRRRWKDFVVMVMMGMAVVTGRGVGRGNVRIRAVTAIDQVADIE